MSNNNSHIKIFISCHKPTAYIKNNIMEPIQLGCANKKNHIKGILHDDDGKDNISQLNPMYCELTAQYWAWKNYDADYYGFCHYRRYFNFTDKKFKEDPYGNIVETYPGEYNIAKYGLDEATITELVDKYDIVITERKDLRKMPGHSPSVMAQYVRAPLLHKKDIHVLLDIIDEKYPEYSKSAHEFLKGHYSSFCNMYILKKEIFFKYAEWMFAVLEEFCKRTDMSKYSTEALRTPGHLSERLFGIFLTQILKENPGLKVKELQCVYYTKTDPEEPLSPVFPKNSNTIPVVFAANNSFIPMFATCLQSLIDHINPKYNYDVILIQSDVSPENKAILLDMVKSHKNLSLRFFDASVLLTDYKLKANAHISVETYYRFLIQDAMPDYHKVLYIDCDLVINGDISKLFETDVDEYILAATRDPDFLGQINGADQETMKYIQSKFKMQDPYNYFQAGVILFNEDEMRKAHTVNEWLEFASTPYRYNDQDVLNLYCEGRVKFIDMKWNMLVDCNHERSEVIEFAPDAIQKEYQLARQDPKIIHYAGFKKPWHDPSEDFAHEFWQYAKQTIYYEELLAQIPKFQLKYAKKNQRQITAKVKNKTKAGVYKTYSLAFPYGSKRWHKLKKLRGKSY